jgi:hypothetical protein
MSGILEFTIIQQIREHDFIGIADDGFAQRAAKGNPKPGIHFAIGEGDGTDEDLAARVALSRQCFLPRIECQQLRFKLALAQK